MKIRKSGILKLADWQLVSFLFFEVEKSFDLENRKTKTLDKFNRRVRARRGSDFRNDQIRNIGAAGLGAAQRRSGRACAATSAGWCPPSRTGVPQLTEIR